MLPLSNVPCLPVFGRPWPQSATALTERFCADGSASPCCPAGSPIAIASTALKAGAKVPLKLPPALKGNQMDIEINITADFTKPGVAAGTKPHSIAGCVLACAPAQSFLVHQPVSPAGFGMDRFQTLGELDFQTLKCVDGVRAVACAGLSVMGTASGAITIGSLPASANPEGINLLKLDCGGKVGQSVIGPRCGPLALALALALALWRWLLALAPEGQGQRKGPCAGSGQLVTGQTCRWLASLARGVDG